MAQIDRHDAVPHLWRHRLDGVAIVSRRIVDEDGDRPERGAGDRYRLAQRGDVGEIAAEKERRRRVKPLDERSRGGFIAVEKGDARSLCAERLDDSGADPGGAAGDEYRARL